MSGTKLIVLDTTDVDVFYARNVLEHRIQDYEKMGWTRVGEIEPTYDKQTKKFGFSQTMQREE